MCVCLMSSVKRKPDVIHLTTGIAQFLLCSPETNLPINWRFSDSTLLPGPRHTMLSQGLIIIPSLSDTGLYTCETVETVNGKLYQKTVVQYLIQVGDTTTAIRYLRVAVATLVILTGFLILLYIKARKRNRIGCAPQRHMEEGRAPCGQKEDPYMMFNSGRDENTGTEEVQNIQTDSVTAVVILPEGTVAKLAEEKVEGKNNYYCTVIDIE